MKKLKESLKVLCLAILVMTIMSTTVFAAEANHHVAKKFEYSEAYKAWLELPDDVRKNTIAPLMYDITTVESKNSNSIFAKTYNNMVSATANLAESYNLKDEMTIRVKNQGVTGECWAFALTSAIETTITKSTGELADEYSPAHVDHSCTNSYADGNVTEDTWTRELASGGSLLNAVSYISAGLGPVLESDFATVVDKVEEPVNKSTLNQTVQARVKDAIWFNSITKTLDENGKLVYQSSGVEIDYDTDVIAHRNQIKEHIMTYGAVWGSMSGNMYDPETGNIFYDQTNASYYMGDPDFASSINYGGHAITIVGWDDSYDKFEAQTLKPEHTGAWIILQSYGTEKFDNGYMYVSYDDVKIDEVLCGLKNITEVDYDYIYQNDKLGMIDIVGYPSGSRVRTEFTKQSNKEEVINEIGLYSYFEQTATIYYQDSTGMNELVADAEVYPGYNTIEVTTPQTINEDTYYIVVEYNCDTLQGQAAFSVEEVNEDIGANPDISGKSEISVYTNNSYTEWLVPQEYKTNDFGFYEYDENGNPIIIDSQIDWCIKAYTTVKGTEPSGITLNKTTAEIEPEETVQLTATITPENADEKTEITWTTSNTNVATVSGTGLVTGVTEGTARITATTENGKTATCIVTVAVDRTATGIAITKEPDKLVYGIGEDLDLTGGEIEVTYDDGYKSTISMKNSEVTASGFNSNTKGVKTVTITYKNLTDTFEVNVSKEISSISLKTEPTKVEYIINKDVLDLTGAVLLVNYNDGSNMEIELPSDKVTATGFNNTSLGTKNITLTYRGFTTTFDVTIVAAEVEKVLESIIIKTNPTKLSYLIGEDLELEGGIITATYSNGDKEEILMTDSRVIVTGYDKNKVGTQTLTVNFQNKLTILTVTVKEAEVKITGITVSKMPTKTEYEKGEVLNLEGGEITVTYSNGNTEVVSMENDEVKVTGFDNTKIGIQLLTVNYKNKLATFKVTVKDEETEEDDDNKKKVSSIKIKSLPSNTTIKKGSKLDLEGGKIIVTYEDGTTETIDMDDPDVTITGFNTFKTGKQTVTVKYGGKTATFQVRVVSSIDDDVDEEEKEQAKDEEKEDEDKEDKKDKEKPVDTGDNIKFYVICLIASLGVILYVSKKIRKI